jgi:ABC-type transport system involved in multi-copper enzyme maturation permease subunit/ABC-type uncharacterized transport system involved in gliding motility auxiliary subunit
MHAVGTLLKRELTSMALLAQTYAIAVAYIIISGVFFIDLVSSAQSADLAAYYANIANTLIVLCPILAARSLAEERSSGQLLISLSWPVSRWALVLSKFIANTIYTWLLVSIAWIYFVQLDAFANPDLARAFGGYVGLLLLSAMFNAITLAVSARASSTASGAFLGFGVLLFLWVVQYLPDSIKGHLDQFGPLSHLDPMLRGIIYFKDVAYFVVLSVGSLLLTIWALSRRRTGTDRQVLLRRVASVLGVIAVFFATPTIANAATGQVDLTPQKRETVSTATKEVIKKVGDLPIVITAFAQTVSSEAADVRTVVRKYRAAGANITDKIIDPDISPGLAAASGITDYNTYLLQVGDRTQEIDDLVESTVTSGISLLSRKDPPKACFTAGNGERKKDDAGSEGLTSFTARLRIIGYEPSTVILSAKGGPELLKQCAVVTMMGARTRFLPADLKVLQDYAKERGRLIIAADAVRGPIDQLNELLSPWGVKFKDGAIRDPQSLADDPAAVVSSRYPTASQIVDVLSHDDTPVIFSNSRALEKTPAAARQDGPQVTTLVMSSPESYLVDPTTGKRLTSEKNQYDMAAVASLAELTGSGQNATTASTRIGIVGSSEVASNDYQKSFGNQELFIRLLQNVAKDDDIVSAYREIGESSKFAITGAQRRVLIRQTVVLPGLAAMIFIPFVLWRLRRG